MDDYSLLATKADSTYLRLRDDIINGVLPPGSKLRLESLVERYGVGMSPLREALARLVGDALAVTEGQRGFWVAPTSICDLKDLTRTRTLIETRALELAILAGGEAWEQGVRSSFNEMCDAESARARHEEGSLARWERANRVFHDSLVAACDSPWLQRMRSLVQRQAERYRRISLAASHFDVEDEHRALMEAVLGRQTLRACLIIQTHFARVEAHIQSALEAAPPTPNQFLQRKRPKRPKNRAIAIT